MVQTRQRFDGAGAQARLDATLAAIGQRGGAAAEAAAEGAEEEAGRAEAAGEAEDRAAKPFAFLVRPSASAGVRARLTPLPPSY